VTRRSWIVRLLAIGAVLAIAYVAEEAIRTLRILDDIEHERDGWQRPDDVLAELQLRPGSRVVDLGSGAGYFALKMAPRVAPGGAVLAVDLRRESLAFLWVRARLRSLDALHVIVGEATNPRLPDGPVDAVLIANTLHEMEAPAQVIARLYRAMHPGARMVIVDRAPRDESAARGHEMTPDEAERIVAAQGLRRIRRVDRFIDRRGQDDVWWLLVFDRPPTS
jgi:ubiquinone/menaquinone biosynthesis C-methylase UbiE